MKMISERFSAVYTEAGLTERSAQLGADRTALVAERDAMKADRDDLAKRAKDAAKGRDAVVKRKGATAAEKTAAREQAKVALKEIDAQNAALRGKLAGKGKEIEAMTRRADRVAAALRK